MVLKESLRRETPKPPEQPSPPEAPVSKLLNKLEKGEISVSEAVEMAYTEAEFYGILKYCQEKGINIPSNQEGGGTYPAKDVIQRLKQVLNEGVPITLLPTGPFREAAARMVVAKTVARGLNSFEELLDLLREKPGHKRIIPEVTNPEGKIIGSGEITESIKKLQTCLAQAIQKGLSIEEIMKETNQPLAGITRGGNFRQYAGVGVLEELIIANRINTFEELVKVLENIINQTGFWPGTQRPFSYEEIEKRIQEVREKAEEYSPDIAPVHFTRGIPRSGGLRDLVNELLAEEQKERKERQQKQRRWF